MILYEPNKKIVQLSPQANDNIESFYKKYNIENFNINTTLKDFNEQSKTRDSK